MMHGPEKSDPVIVAGKPANKAAPLRSIRRAARRSRWSQGRGPRGMRTGKARTGLRARRACHRRWNAYGRTCCRHTPEVGAVCGKAARTDLCGGREATRVPTAKTAGVHRGARRGGVADGGAGAAAAIKGCKDRYH